MLTKKAAFSAALPLELASPVTRSPPVAPLPSVPVSLATKNI